MTAVAAPPIAATVATVDETIPWCSYRLGLPGDAVVGSAAADPIDSGRWINCADALRNPSFFTRWRHSVSTLMADSYPDVPVVTPAGYIMCWYVGMFGYLGGMLFHEARRVPSLAPENLAFLICPTRGRPATIALLDGSFACLPGDRDAGTPGATVLPDDAALAGLLRTETAEHGARFVASYRTVCRFGPHTLWGAVTDALDRGVWHIANRRGDDASGATDAALVLPDPCPPFTSGSTIRAVAEPGGSGAVHWTRTRQSCCFYYKLPGIDSACPTCPRLTEGQRLERLADL